MLSLEYLFKYTIYKIFIIVYILFNRIFFFFLTFNIVSF